MKPLRRLVRAPSNIALIKYMGKTDTLANLPENPSLSMTLDALCTWVEIETAPGTGASCLEAGLPSGLPVPAREPALSDAGRAKALRHVERTRAACIEILPAHGLAFAGAERDLSARTANTFPEASGIASSASSFAALTLATAWACSEDPSAFERAWERDVGLKRALARVSRQGSGSSCRSFEGPFVLWEGESARALETRMPELAHFVVLVSAAAKAVSSSEAHARVKTSPLWQGRRERVETRLAGLRAALATGDVAAVAKLAWSESWEMHSLFHTAEPPFTYWKPASLEALEWFGSILASGEREPPIVTMDAGPNVHVIVPAARASEWRAKLSERFGADRLLADRPGRGAQAWA